MNQQLHTDSAIRDSLERLKSIVDMHQVALRAKSRRAFAQAAAASLPLAHTVRQLGVEFGQKRRPQLKKKCRAVSAEPTLHIELTRQQRLLCCVILSRFAVEYALHEVWRSATRIPSEMNMSWFQWLAEDVSPAMQLQQLLTAKSRGSQLLITASHVALLTRATSWVSASEGKNVNEARQMGLQLKESPEVELARALNLKMIALSLGVAA